MPISCQSTTKSSRSHCQVTKKKMPPKVSGKAAKKSGKASKAIVKSDKKKKKPRYVLIGLFLFSIHTKFLV